MNQENSKKKLTQKDVDLMKAEVERLEILYYLYENQIDELSRKLSYERSSQASRQSDRDKAATDLQTRERYLKESKQDVERYEKKIKVATDEKNRVSTLKGKVTSEIRQYDNECDCNSDSDG